MLSSNGFSTRKGFSALGSTGTVFAVLVLCACHRPASGGPPPHTTVNVTPPAISSTLDVPVSQDLALLQRLLDKEIPRKLWSIDQDGATCVQPKRVALLGARIAVTPRLKCRIVGTARRGDITLHGEGDVIRADVPIIAEVHVEKLAGFVGATATGAAVAHARIRLTLSRDWQAHGTIRIDYDWKTPPAILILGRRVGFTDKAEEKLRPFVARLEQSLPGELAKLKLHDKAAALWAKSFAVVSLNDHNPPVWLRVVPQRLAYGGYDVVGRRLVFRLGMVALTQAVVGDRPPPALPTPLPAMTSEPAPRGQVRLFAPVVADYAQLTPVITRFLAKRAQRPFDIPGIGAVQARFDRVETYGAAGGRIAVGADIAAEVPGRPLASAHGRIWFSAVPHNTDGSQIVSFTDLAVSGQTDHAGGDLLLSIADSPIFSQTIADALTQNLSGDYSKLLVKIRTAIAHRRQGDFHIDARMDDARNGRIVPYANGIYMPVWLNGRARVSYDPR